MKICCFGTYLSNYHINEVLIKGLKKANVEIIECHVPLWELTRSKAVAYKKAGAKLKVIFQTVTAYVKLVMKHVRVRSYDAIIVSYIGHIDIFLAKFLTLLSKKPIVFNPILSLFDTMIIDRQLYETTSLPAKIIWTLDSYACRLADIVFIDTQKHMEIWVNNLNCPKDKIKQLFFGADDAIFYPRESQEKNSRFRVLFYGEFIPLQGVPFIVGAAKILEKEDIDFEIIGSGQLTNEVELLRKDMTLENVEFIDWVEFEELPEHIAKADICLGIFGTTDKMQRCIANKVIQAVAMAKPVITGDSPAIREAFTDRENIFLCKRGNSEALAEAIKVLRRNDQLRARIAEGGYILFKEKFSPESIGKKAGEIISRLVCETQSK